MTRDNDGYNEFIDTQVAKDVRQDMVIKKIAEIISQDSEIPNMYLVFLRKVLNTLPIEFVDDETEPMEGDIVKKKNFFIKRVVSDHSKELTQAQGVWCGGLTFMREQKPKIIRRNGKAAININDIKEA